MGADLYMNDAYKKREKKLAPQIQEALDDRKANPDDKDAHQKAMDLYDKLYFWQSYVVFRSFVVGRCARTH